MLHPKGARSFSEYSSNVLIPYIMLKFHNATHLGFVWSRYIENSLEGKVMAKRGKGVCRRLVAEGVILKNWEDFFQVYSNKSEPFNFLTKALFVTFYSDGKHLVITGGNSILSNPTLCDPHSLSSCTCEKADIYLLLYTNCPALWGHFKVLIKTVDTDVVVLAVCYSTTWSRLYTSKELWIAFGAGISATWLLHWE